MLILSLAEVVHVLRLLLLIFKGILESLKNVNKDIFDVLRASLATQALFSQSSQLSAFMK